jgi:hypothetical protein
MYFNYSAVCIDLAGYIHNIPLENSSCSLRTLCLAGGEIEFER